jgi:hypothetical protein
MCKRIQLAGIVSNRRSLEPWIRSIYKVDKVRPFNCRRKVSNLFPSDDRLRGLKAVPIVLAGLACPN